MAIAFFGDALAAATADICSLLPFVVPYKISTLRIFTCVLLLALPVNEAAAHVLHCSVTFSLLDIQIPTEVHSPVVSKFYSPFKTTNMITV